MAKIERITNYYQKPEDFLEKKNFSIIYYGWKIIKYIKSVWWKNAKV